MNPIASRLECLRQRMAADELEAIIIPRADEYLGEYIPERNERLRWISGFTGSAGVVIVLRDRAAIFVDGRYTVQVRRQVPEQHFEILHWYDDPHIEWLASKLQKAARIGYDPRLHSYQWQQQAEKTLAAAGMQGVALEENPVDACWSDRPGAAVQPALLMPESLTGESSLQKRRAIGRGIGQQGADAALIFPADSCAWLLNIRGNDVPCLPVVLGFGLLQADGSFRFFTDPDKIPADFHQHVGAGVDVLPESEAEAVLAGLSGRTVLADPLTANAWCHLQLRKAGARIVEADDPVSLPKACKNPAEVDGMRRAHVRDGAAVVRFLAWLDREVEAGRLHTEAELSDRLFDFRSAGNHFRGGSFDTISAAGGNAAMCHYNHLNFEDVSRLTGNSVYLVDSGGQYLDGTTDITRTVAIGEPGDEVTARFTLVLKGHIALDRARFPEGTNGTQLDILARQHLWRAGLDYDHGTGHGVGAFLSVHEGPQRIGKQPNSHALRAGMVVSNEPGFYKDNAYGMRCENLVVVRECGDRNDDGPAMLEFEVLTLAPFDRRLIRKSLLTDDEVAWIDDYHARVRQTLSDRLDEPDRRWLDSATAPL